MNLNKYSRFKHLLVDPYTKDSLTLNTNLSFFKNKNNNQYPIKQNVCVFINQKEINTQNFNYIEHYQNDGKEFDYSIEYSSKTTQYEIYRLYQTITSLIKIKPNITILDVGCGNGWVAKEFVKKGCNVISVDISFENTSRIINQIPDENHIALMADSYNLPIKENSVDYIIASEIMEHVIDPKLFIKSLFNVLKKDGKLIITTPYNEVIEHSLCIHCNKKTPKNAHLHSFNESNIKNYLPENIGNYKSFRIHNKALIKLNIHRALYFLPLKLWLFLDKLVSYFYNKSYRLILVVKK